VVGLALFLMAERRAAAPILPLYLFRIRTFALTSLIGVSVGQRCSPQSSSCRSIW
jgi:hypothetical protein